MGRAHLSTKYGIDDLPRRKSPCPEPPRYIDAPFDLDAGVDAPDAVYEAFLTPEQLRRRDEEVGTIIIPRETAASPVESLDSDEASSDATTQPSTRVPSPARQNRSIAGSQRADSPVDTGMRVLELMEPLADARAAALPAIQAAMEEGVTQVEPLVRRLTSILRPHIGTAIAPFVTDVPEVQLFGQMFERSLVLDILGSSSITAVSGGFPTNDILRALDAIGDTSYSRSQSDTAIQPDEETTRSEDHLMTDPASEATVIPTTLPHAAYGWAQESYARSPRTAPSPPPHNPIYVMPSIRSRLQYVRSQAMDVDSDDDARSNSSSFSGRSGSFTPRVVRARDGLGRRSYAAGLSSYEHFSSLGHYVPAEPLR